VLVEEAEGWRLVVDPLKSPYCVLVGGRSWAAELTADEARALRRGLGRLQEEHRAAASMLMEEEIIELEIEIQLLPTQGASITDGSGERAGGLWIGLEGNRDSWEIRFVLTPSGSGRRGIEGGWPAGVSAGFTAALNLSTAGIFSEHLLDSEQRLDQSQL
jgi:hypothetical protein